MKKVLVTIGIIIGIVFIQMILLNVSHRCLYPKSPIAKGEQTISHRLTILSYNTHRLGEFQKPEKNEVLQYLKSCAVDVVCLQEVEVYHDELYLTERELLSAMRNYPYRYLGYSVQNHRRNFGNVIFSKYPLLNACEVDYISRSNNSLVVDVLVKGDTIRLINNHLESNRIERRDIDSVVQARSIHGGQLEEKLKHTNRLRHEQARAVSKEVSASPYPVVVVGDLNAIPCSITYMWMRWRLQDCFLKCSNGRLGCTMKYLNFPLRIDYVFCTRDLTPWGMEVDRVPGSDHYPIRATIVW